MLTLSPYSHPIIEELQRAIREDAVICDDTAPLYTTNLFAFRYAGSTDDVSLAATVVDAIPLEASANVKRGGTEHLRKYGHELLNAIDEETFYRSLRHLLTEGMVVEPPMYLNEPEKAEAWIGQLKQLSPGEKRIYLYDNSVLHARYCTDKSFFLFTGDVALYLLFLGYD